MLVVAPVLTIAEFARVYSGIRREELRLVGSGGGGTTYLLVGSDARAFADDPAAAARSGSAPDATSTGADITMLLRVPDDGAPFIVSVPRDLIVEFADGSRHRLTLARARGLQSLVDVVCAELGIGVDHVAEIGFAGFRDLVDAVGGVDVFVGVPARDEESGLDLPWAGTHHLDGQMTLAYVRSRHPQVQVNGLWIPLPGGAQARLDHSKEVAQKLGEEVSAARRNPIRLHQVLTAAVDAITVDEGMGIADLRQLGDALQAAGLDTGEERATNLPVLEHADELSTSELSASSLPVLERLGAGNQPACPRPRIA